MIYSEATNYALHTMALLAQIEGDSRVGVQVLAERQGLSSTYLSKILAKLVKKNLIDSTRGATGGYRLAKLPSEISFLDVIQAIEGETNSFSGCIHDDAACTINRIMHESEMLTQDYLRNKKISEVLKNEENA